VASGVICSLAIVAFHSLSAERHGTRCGNEHAPRDEIYGKLPRSG